VPTVTLDGATDPPKRSYRVLTVMRWPVGLLYREGCHVGLTTLTEPVIFLIRRAAPQR
jgi:hypothetical protein